MSCRGEIRISSKQSMSPPHTLGLRSVLRYPLVYTQSLAFWFLGAALETKGTPQAWCCFTSNTISFPLEKTPHPKLR